jgi:hypothetical protein
MQVQAYVFTQHTGISCCRRLPLNNSSAINNNNNDNPPTRSLGSVARRSGSHVVACSRSALALCQTHAPTSFGSGQACVLHK